MIEDLKATYEQAMIDAKDAMARSNERDAQVKVLANELDAMTWEENYDQAAYLALEVQLEDAEKTARAATGDASRKNMAALSALHAWEDAK